MSEQHLGNSGSRFTYMDIDQLVEDARRLRAKTISEAVRGTKNRLKSVLTKWSDYSFGAHQLKKNKRVKLIRPV